ncbi:MAG: transposase, partial [Sulfuricella sp.]
MPSPACGRGGRSLASRVSVKLRSQPSAWHRRRNSPKTRAGKARYALRKQTVEPVFGIIKSVMGFRQFILRGLEKV